jgi:uncharacterized protein
MSESTRVNQIDFIELSAPSKEALVSSKLFYKNVFGWIYKDWGDDFADTQSSGVGSGINAFDSSSSARSLVVIYVEELETARKKIADANGVITKEIFSFPGGRRFHFKDPAGNELAVWSDK